MPDPTPPAAAGADPTPPAAAAVVDPKPGEGGAAPFDPTKLGDGDLAKVLEDPRLWSHPRMVELTSAKKALDKAKEDQKKADDEALVKNKQFEELAARRTQEAEAARTELQTERLNNRIITEATKKGVVDVDAALKLLDRSKIKVGEDGKIEGIVEALDALLTDKPYLGGKKGGVGHGTQPAATGDGEKIKLSDIRNPVYYQAHRAEILKAQIEGRVEDDTQSR